MFCWKCGGKLSNNAKFCPSCGSPYIDEKTEAQNPIPFESAQDLEVTRIVPSEQYNSAEMKQPGSFNSEDEVKAYIPAPTPPVISNEETTPRQVPSPPVINTLSLQKEDVNNSDADNNDVQEKPKVKPIRKKSTAKTVILSVVLGLFIFLLGFADALGFIIQATLDKAEISKAVSKSDMSEIVVGDIISETGMSELLIEANFITESIDSEATLAELISKNTDFNIKKSKKLLKNTFVTEYIGKVINAYECYILNNEETKMFKGDKVCDVIEDNIDEISDIAGEPYLVYEDEIDYLADYIDDYISMIAPENALNETGALTSFILSPIILISVAVIILIFVILLGIITHDTSSTILTTGICAFLTGGILVLIPVFRNKILSVVGLDYDIFTDYISDILKNTIFLRLDTYGLIILATGAVLIIIATIIKVILAAVRKNKVA